VSELQVVSVIGVDPGVTTGISFLDYIDKRLAGTMQVQVDAKSATALLETLLLRFYNSKTIVQRWAQIEPFKTGQSAGAKGEPAEVTRQQAFILGETLQMYGYHTELRKKGDISTWGSNKRLEKAGIIRQLDGMRHANDASRHALYCAVHDAHMPDPLR
jgi:hypothetical protein